jgi:pectate lyase
LERFYDTGIHVLIPSDLPPLAAGRNSIMRGFYMKNRFWRFAAISGFCTVLSSFNVQSQTPYYLTSPVGYGSGVTGGGAPTSSNTVTAASSSELSSALSGDKSVILVSGTITTGRIECTASNKSIIGLPGAMLQNLTQTKDGSGILNLKSGSNIIIRNIIFVGPGAYDEDGWDLITNKGVTKLWVDHCEFQDGMDGNFDNTNSADNITVSWCKFTYLKPPKAGGSGGSNDHRFTNLVGGSDTDVPGDGKYSITWLNCWWADGCVDRMVRARNAQIDMLNCYWNSRVASKNIHLSPGTNGTFVYVENGVFACTGDIVNFEKTGNNNVKFVTCTGGGSNTGSVSAPTYSWTPTPVGAVVSRVTSSTCGAGAKLEVTAAGVISSNCSGTPVDATRAISTSADPAIFDINGNIRFLSSSSEKAVATLYSMNGRKICAFSKRANASPDIRRLDAGVYIVTIQDALSMVTGTCIKK